MTSHAAVVARGMGKCCVSGCGELVLDDAAGTMQLGGKTFGRGDLITLNGTTGEIIDGEVPTIEPKLDGNFRQLMDWANAVRTMKVRTNADSPHDSQLAREFGDLRENAEYKAAKERQVILHRRAEELQNLLDHARPIVPSTVTGEAVAPGTRIHVKNRTSDEEESYSLLGMWDADPDQGIIFYKAPFAAQFLRHREGETLTITIPSGESFEYEILRIERAV